MTKSKFIDNYYLAQKNHFEKRDAMWTLLSKYSDDHDKARNDPHYLAARRDYEIAVSELSYWESIGKLEGYLEEW